MNVLPQVLLLAALSSSIFTAGPAGAQTAAPVASPAHTASVDTKNFAYAPPTITVDSGTTVVFSNFDTIAHTVTAKDNSFDSGDMPQGKTWSHLFSAPGTYQYYCGYHTYMTGTVIVK